MKHGMTRKTVQRRKKKAFGEKDPDVKLYRINIELNIFIINYNKKKEVKLNIIFILLYFLHTILTDLDF